MARVKRPIKLGNSWFSAKSFRASASDVHRWGRALDGLGSDLTKPNQTQIPSGLTIRQTDGGDKVRRRGETAQTVSLRPQIVAKWGKDVEGQDNQEVGLEAAIL